MNAIFIIGMLMAIPPYAFLFKFLPAESINVMRMHQLIGLIIQIIGLSLILLASNNK